MIKCPDHWQEIGWDSIYLQLPEDWQPTVILKSYLLFERDNKPACEIKWQPARGKFSPGSVLKRFQQTLGKDVAISEWTVPDVWRQALQSFIVSGFRLRHGTLLCHGFLLYCPHSRRTLLIRLYFDPAAEDRIVTHILQSLADHDKNDERLWSMYDIRALLPVQLKLQTHEFQPGRFTLTFSYAGTTITLYRIKPAGVILKKQSLADFGTSLGGRNVTVTENNDLVNFTHQARGLDLLRTRLRRKPSWHWFRLSHVPAHNVILGIKGEGRNGRDVSLLEHVSRNFTVTEPR